MRNSKGHEKKRRGWAEGKVDPAGEHIGIFYEGHPGLMALVANCGAGITVEFLAECEREAKAAITEELDFYFVRLGEKNPWAYAKYHCSTAANAYSKVQWGYFPTGQNIRKGDDP